MYNFIVFVQTVIVFVLCMIILVLIMTICVQYTTAYALNMPDMALLILNRNFYSLLKNNLFVDIINVFLLN